MRSTMKPLKQAHPQLHQHPHQHHRQHPHLCHLKWWSCSHHQTFLILHHHTHQVTWKCSKQQKRWRMIVFLLHHLIPVPTLVVSTVDTCMHMPAHLIWLILLISHHSACFAVVSCMHTDTYTHNKRRDTELHFPLFILAAAVKITSRNCLLHALPQHYHNG